MCHLSKQRGVVYFTQEFDVTITHTDVHTLVTCIMKSPAR